MDYKAYLSDFGKGISTDIDFFKERSDDFLKGYDPLFTRETAKEQNKSRIKPNTKSGIIMTDLSALAKKFGVKEKKVAQVLADFQYSSESIGIHWEFLDASPKDYDYIFKEFGVWEAYSRILSDFMAGTGLDPDPELGLFIIGGDDVIPMPKIECPLSGLTSDPLDVDFMYCFDLDESGNDCFNNPRCCVGRFPFENGKVKDGLNLLEDYFNRTFGLCGAEGLYVESGIMTSTESWLPSSREMIRNLPIKELMPEFDCTDKNMFISPALSASSKKTQKKFNEAIADADFLMFNLHGSDDVDSDAYYGEDMRHSLYPEAFTAENLAHTSAVIINSTACFGGRYIGYDRNHSMLLRGIYSSTLLYTASCTTALGRGNGYSQAIDLLMPAGMSETLIKLYTIYLYQGMNAGEALLRAKIDYFLTCKEMDGSREALSTVYMFNLYGNPLLNMKPVLVDNALGKYESKNMNTKNTKTTNPDINTGLDEAIQSISNDVRNAVDSGLADIRETIMETLYTDWGLKPEDFSEMDTIVVNGKEKGYVLTYAMKSGPLKRKVFAKTDLEGKVVDIIHTK